MQSEKALQIDFMGLAKICYRYRFWIAAAAVTGLLVGFAHYKLSKKIYSSEVVFTSEAGQGKGGRLEQLAAFAGGLSLGNESSPYLNFIEQFSRTRELSTKMKNVKFGDSTLVQMLVKSKPTQNDTDFAFHNALSSLYQLKKDKDGLLVLSAKTNSPSLSRFLADRIFTMLDSSIRGKKIDNINNKLEFVNSLVGKYDEEMKSASDRIRSFSEKNLGASSPALLQQREFLGMDLKLAQEKYLFAIKQREELRVQMEEKQEQLIVIEPAYVPIFPTFPTKAKSFIPPVALLCLLSMVIIAYVTRKAWIYPE